MTYTPLDHEYDAVPYPFLTHHSTHPNHLAVMGTIFGIKPADPKHCRVLEVGCALGGNIIPMAYSLPNSEFLGIDYSKKQIKLGQEAIFELGLSNIQLTQVDIVDTPEDLGVFDYIIAHGLYSWVSQPVREDLMSLCGRHLAPEGIAYISYNTYPGWQMMLLVRDTMLYASRNASDPEEIVSQSQQILDFLLENIPPGQTGYRSLFETYLAATSSRKNVGNDDSASMMLHDELATINQPVYFRDFADHAQKHKLQYLSESKFSAVMNPPLSAEALNKIEAMSKDLVEFEQYVDITTNKSFRRTLLVHDDLEINRQVKPESVVGFRFMSRVKSLSEQPDFSPGIKESFEGSDGAVFTTDHALSKAVLHYLREHQPNSFTFDHLINSAINKLGGLEGQQIEIEKQAVAASLLQAYSYSSALIGVEMAATQFTTKISKLPLASRLARWQLSKGYHATNLRHERVELDPIAALILRNTDGTNSFETLLSMMKRWHAEGKFELSKDKAEKTDDPEKLLAKELGLYLAFFARSALLEA